MGVPALFRWLSKKYPKIISEVAEDDVTIQTGDPGDPQAESIDIPVNMADPNPNGTEFDNLYLDMNGIVHPCTHPEGKPAPETEEDMMIEVFKYTERVVNMVRPRKLLFMAIDGVAPRAKMNQQRSRRFRAAQEAKDKEEARKESVALWESMGKSVSEDDKNKKAWDSNAITPGTPFMALLASSLRYWVVQKMNSDAGWKNIQVIISDASVPGEGEHKIMDFIRRQRVNPGHDPNTRHVIYGLDADLIMLALATHEPHFRVLREDVFSDANSTCCRKCGQEGHYAAQCTVSEDEIQKKASAVVQKPKPFIFLDVAVLREYLEVELDAPQAAFPFDLERAIDDWVLLIFFVGNDFLPHLPSLEIREGAIDTLLRIWKQELPRMGGYLANHGQLELSRVQIILEGLARREDEIFKRRREAENRQDANAKRRKLEAQNGNTVTVGSSSSVSQTGGPTSPSNNSSSHPVHPSLPQRPDFAANADSVGLGGPRNAQAQLNMSAATQALAGSNRDVVANIRAIRMANMSAAEMLKAELSGKPDLSLPAKPPATADVPSATLDASRMRSPSRPTATVMQADSSLSQDISMESITEIPQIDDSVVAGIKRKAEEGPEADDDTLPDEEEEDTANGNTPSLSLKVNADGTVDQEDTVKLWEPGYKERYYRQKFGVELSDMDFRKALVKNYVEGMAWVLRYYYQGAPSWQWYYPHHFAPFASDFVDIEALDITFDLGEPFKPFEQLMGVFPAASRVHIPAVFHTLMIDEDSPIIDYYPESFQIDMNGKKMAWQGVALLPFIDEKRLLTAMAEHYGGLSEEELCRNSWGNSIIFASDEHPIYPFYEQLYGKRKSNKAVTIDISLSKGISGNVLPNPECLPGSTFYNPLTSQDLPDIRNDRSLSVIYFFPKQISPHRSVMLPGVKKGPRVLQAHDLEITRSGGRGRGRGGWDRGGGRGGGGRSNGNDRPRGGDPFHSRPSSYGPPRGNDRGYEGRGGGGNSYHPNPYQSRPPPPPQQQYGGGGYGGYAGDAGAGAYGGYGGGSLWRWSLCLWRDSGPPRGPPPNSYGSYGGYGSGGGAYGGGGGAYGSYGQGGSYGGGGYGSNSGAYGQSTNGYGGHNGGGRGGGGYSSRGRGRAW
ncbi:XRN 5'-3' exonuclease N-terminus-domain-containing protein [Armillaria luteobubalina]|uniref:5'-3' exoribonuclease n=1 Tax=Armillaria luteobubalina TaxID=153913 RepID=A0AA39QDU3_9AGAR|nr:XRN 5'-3' exonuclease N-terminus-domain-containing protein [Armillaria luteobubalina]